MCDMRPEQISTLLKWTLPGPASAASCFANGLPIQLPIVAGPETQPLIQE